jgi:hypothetical protein
LIIDEEKYIGFEDFSETTSEQRIENGQMRKEDKFERMNSTGKRGAYIHLNYTYVSNTLQTLKINTSSGYL